MAEKQDSGHPRNPVMAEEQDSGHPCSAEGKIKNKPVERKHVHAQTLALIWRVFTECF